MFHLRYNDANDFQLSIHFFKMIPPALLSLMKFMTFVAIDFKIKTDVVIEALCCLIVQTVGLRKPKDSVRIVAA